MVTSFMSSSERLVGGWLPSPPKPSDYDFTSLLLPRLNLSTTDIDLSSFCSEISDQKKSNSCVANATADAYELCMALDGNQIEQISRLQIYFNGRSRMSLDGITNMATIDSGMYVRSAFEAINIMGVCPESMWPFDLSKINERPSIAATWYALKHKIAAYYAITEYPGQDQYDAIVKALQGRHPVVFGFGVNDTFLNWDGSDVIPAMAPGDKIMGMHGIMAVGVINGDIKIRNSWGSGWGDNGYAIMSKDWFINGYCYEPWVPTSGVNLKP